jgi:Dockerin type I domain
VGNRIIWFSRVLILLSSLNAFAFEPIRTANQSTAELDKILNFGRLIDPSTMQLPEWASIRTAKTRIIFNNAGNMGQTGNIPGCNLGFFDDCDSTDNLIYHNNNSLIYLYDASPFLLRIKGTDTLLNSYIYGADWLEYDGLRPLEGLMVDSSGPDFQYAYTGQYASSDTQIIVECQYWAPKSPDSSNFLVREIRVHNNSGATINGLFIGDLMDWNIPSDHGVNNNSGIDISRKMVYCYGGEYGADPLPNNDCVESNQRYAAYSYYGGCHFPYSIPGADSIPYFRTIFTDTAGIYVAGGKILRQKLYNNLIGNYGITIIQDTVDLLMVSALAQVNLLPTDTFSFTNIFAVEYNGGLTGLRSAVDKGIQWLKNRPNLLIWPDYFAGPLVVTAYSPVNLRVTDPQGRFIGLDADDNLQQTLFPANYYNDMPPTQIDSVVIFYPIVGPYVIEVIPEADAPPGSTYSAGVRIDGTEQCFLITNAQVYGATNSYTYNVEEGWHYKNGDANDNGIINIQDITFLISYLYKGGPPPIPVGAGDANCSGIVNIQDITYLINFLYKGGPLPCDIS